MYEFFAMHREQAVGNFFVQDVALTLEADSPQSGEAHETMQHAVGNGSRPRLEFTAWLAPYDFGVSHRVTLWTEEVAPGTLGWRLDVLRLSGDVTSWKRATQMFLKRIRKQLLLWRTVKPEDRHTYRAIARQQLHAASGEKSANAWGIDSRANFRQGSDLERGCHAGQRRDTEGHLPV